jgi:hypothetical protein
MSADGVPPVVILTGPSGVGKTQLAAACARDRWRAGLDLLVWADASRRDGLLSAYACAAARVQAPGVTGAAADLESDAGAFLRWAACTTRSWLVVLDDLPDPLPPQRWWPASVVGTGQLLATASRHDADLSGAGRRLLRVPGYSLDEARAYLASRLGEVGRAELVGTQADALAEELGRLPLALSHAAAYLIDEGVTCRDYLDLLTSRTSRLDVLMRRDPDRGVPGDGGSRAITSTLLLALDAVEAHEPTGLARSALTLAATFNPAGHPDTVWETRPVLRYLGSSRGGLFGTPVSREEAQAAVGLLARYELLGVTARVGGDRDSDRSGVVTLNRLTARAVRERAGDDVLLRAVRAAAAGLVAVWPADDRSDRAAAARLRANAAVLDALAGDALWHPLNGNALRSRQGTSLLDAGATFEARDHWTAFLADATRLFGAPEDTDCGWLLDARGNLAAALARTGDPADLALSVALREDVVRRLSGALPPDEARVLTAQVNLAAAYARTGREDDAVLLLRHVVARRGRTAGEDACSTVAARSVLSAVLHAAGLHREAAELLERSVWHRESRLGRDHPETLRDLANLASVRAVTDQVGEALLLGHEVVDGRARVLGEDHRETLTARANLAEVSYRTGRRSEAVEQLQGVWDDRRRVLGSDHPHSQAAEERLNVWARADRSSGRARWRRFGSRRSG